jgi:molecular chaperone GrpE
VSNIEATRRAFLETLRRYGVERVDPQGEPFDPNVHEAIGHAPVEGVPADHVAQVVQAGYVEGDRVIRPARVLVSAG